MHPRAKSIFGVGALFMLCLFGVRTSPAAQVVLSDPLTSWPLNFGAQGCCHVEERRRTYC
jgi:hypothetical protein